MVKPSTGPNLGIWNGFATGASGWGADLNASLRLLDAVIFFTTQMAPQNTPPVTYAQGDRYIIGAAPTGIWASYANNLAVYTTDETNTALWQYIAPEVGMQAIVIPSGSATATATYLYADSAWQVVVPSGVSSAALDSVFGSVVGDILYRGSSGWETLSAGTEGQVLTTSISGSVTALDWATPSSGGTTIVSSGIDLTLGTLAIDNVLDLTFVGGTLTGSSSSATYTAPSGGGGGSGMPAFLPGIGPGIVSGAWNRPALSSMTTYTAGGAEIIDVSGGPISHNVYDNGSVFSSAGISVDSTAPWTVDMLISIDGSSLDGSELGMLVANTSTGNIVVFQVYFNNTVTPTLRVDHYGSFPTGSSGYTNKYSMNAFWTHGLQWLRIQYDGTNITFATSEDGFMTPQWAGKTRANNVNYPYSETMASFLGTANFVGTAITSQSNQSAVVLNLWAINHTTP